MTNLLYFQLGLSADKIAWLIQHMDWERGLIEASIPLCHIVIFILTIYAIICALFLIVEWIMRPGGVCIY